MHSIICEEEKEENDMASNLRVRFRERQCKHLSESIAANPSHLKKACPEPTPNPLSQLASLTNTTVVALEPDEKPPFADDISYHETREPFVIWENIREESFECLGSPIRPKPTYVPS